MGGAVRWFGVRRAGRIFELQSAPDSAYRRTGGGARSCVTGFSWASRRRLLRAIGAIQWGAVGSRWFLTLTYPAVFPTDGRECKRHLDIFRRRLCRKYGRPLVLVWKMEFQRRGAVHFHILLPAVAGVALVDFQRWCSQAWYEVVQSGDAAHLLAGTNVQEAVSDCSRYMAYALKEKDSQNDVPPEFTNPGRFWGIWGFRPEWCGALLTEKEFVSLRRVVSAWSRSKGRRVNVRSRYQGSWYLTDNPNGGLVLAQLVRVLDRDVRPLLL
jgi:hypothetical protein